MWSYFAYVLKSVPMECALKTNFHTLTERRKETDIDRTQNLMKSREQHFQYSYEKP